MPGASTKGDPGAQVGLGDLSAAQSWQNVPSFVLSGGPPARHPGNQPEHQRRDDRGDPPRRRGAAGPGMHGRDRAATAGPRSIEGAFDEAVSMLGTPEWVLRRGPRSTRSCSPASAPIPCHRRRPRAHRQAGPRDRRGRYGVGGLLGHRFSIVTTSPRWKPLLEDAVRTYGFAIRCASVRSSGLAVLDLDALPRGAGDRDAGRGGPPRRPATTAPRRSSWAAPAWPDWSSVCVLSWASR